MPDLPLPQLVFLGLVLVAFTSFTVTLISVSLYTLVPSPNPKRPAARETRPVRRVERFLAP